MFAAVRWTTTRASRIIIAARSVNLTKSSAKALLSTQQTPITSSIHDEHVDPEVRFMSADGLKAEHDRLQKMKMKMEGQVEKDNTEDDDADWPSVDQILREEHAHEDDPEHFVMNERELEHQKVLKKQQKDARDKDDDIRHHAWE